LWLDAVNNVVGASRSTARLAAAAAGDDDDDADCDDRSRDRTHGGIQSPPVWHQRRYS